MDQQRRRRDGVFVSRSWVGSDRDQVGEDAFQLVRMQGEPEGIAVTRMRREEPSTLGGLSFHLFMKSHSPSSGRTANRTRNKKQEKKNGTNS